MPHPEYRNPCDIPGVLRCSGYVDGRNARERALDEAINEEVHDLPGAIRAAAVARYLEQRTAAHEALRSHRVMVLDVASEELPAALVERYLAVKRDGLL